MKWVKVEEHPDEGGRVPMMQVRDSQGCEGKGGGGSECCTNMWQVVINSVSVL